MKTILKLSLRLLAIILVTVIYNAIASCAPGYHPVLSATTQNPITGRTAGAYGPAVFTTWKGLNVMKTKPETVRNPQTVAQTDQRTKFTLIQNFCSAALQALKIGFRDLAIHMSEFNAAMKYNLPEAITGSSPDWARDYSKLNCAQGTLANATDLAIATPSVAGFIMTWTDNSGEGNALANDKMRSVILIEGSDLSTKVKSVIVDTIRSAETATVVLPSSWVGETVHAHMFFVSDDGQLISDSGYVGTDTLTA